MKLNKGHLRIALMLLAVTVAWNLWVYLKPAAKPVPTQPLLSNATPSAPQQAASDRSRVDPATIPAPPAVDLGREPRWSRDAFLFGNESRDLKPVPAAQVVAGPDPVIRSILFSPGRRLAVVEGKIVKVGDKVGSNEVVDIQRDAVVFKTATGDRRRVALLGAAPPGITR